MDIDDADEAAEQALRDWLRELKERSGASYRKIGLAIGESPRNVSRWMSAEDPVTPGGDKLLRLLDFFGVRLTPPAPRAVALSLMGELRELREELLRLRGTEAEDEPASLADVELRLRALQATAEDLKRMQKEMLANQASALELMTGNLRGDEASGTSQ